MSMVRAMWCAVLGSIIGLTWCRPNPTDDELEVTDARHESVAATTTTEVAAPANVPHVPSRIEPESDWTIEQLVEAYLRAPTWQRRIPFLLDADRSKPLMAAHYVEYRPLSRFTIRPIPSEEIEVGDRVQVIVDLPNSSPVPYVVARAPSGFRIDWRASRALHEKLNEAGRVSRLSAASR